MLNLNLEVDFISKNFLFITIIIRPKYSFDNNDAESMFPFTTLSQKYYLLEFKLNLLLGYNLHAIYLTLPIIIQIDAIVVMQPNNADMIISFG